MTIRGWKDDRRLPPDTLRSYGASVIQPVKHRVPTLGCRDDPPDVNQRTDKVMIIALEPVNRRYASAIAELMKSRSIIGTQFEVESFKDGANLAQLAFGIGGHSLSAVSCYFPKLAWEFYTSYRVRQST
ncbi:hypothetical protein HAX54_027521 [Datura stramonium]|uniref:Uncharacterized protein n=1 Tax=Datura stramonium TaxID=4076 RepID=A0ABS8V4S7_DATST|nr:hypothetical protein [Datura stramonium]